MPSLPPLRAAYLAPLAVLGLTLPAHAYLGGFEVVDGYSITHIGDSVVGPYAEATFSGSSGPEVFRYNAGTPSPGVLTAYAATAPSIASDARVWTSTGLTDSGWYALYGQGVARDRSYVNAHYVPAVLAAPQYGAQALAFRSGDLDVASSLPVAPAGGMAVTYRLDSSDLAGYANTSAALANRVVTFSFDISYAGWVTHFPSSTDLTPTEYLLSSVNNDASLMEIDIGGRPNPGANYAAIQGTYGIRLRFYDNQRIDIVHGNGSGGETVTRVEDAQGDLRANWRGWTAIRGYLDLQNDTYGIEITTTAAPTPTIATGGTGPYNNAGTFTTSGALRNALDAFGNISIAGREDPDGGGIFKNYIDNLTFASPVPEPSTWAALVGASALGFALLRRRRTEA